MKTVKTRLFTIKDKEDGKRYLMKLTGEPKTQKQFRDSFPEFAEEYDFRTIRWLEGSTEISKFTGVSVSLVFDSQDNPFFEV